LLGPSYRYTNDFGYNGDINNGILKGNLILTGSGDPTLGSWRYDSTRNDQQLTRLMLCDQTKASQKLKAH
jgi:D-alanyl-D-alanine carboxypeptidase/D-alanyl-D-alanine-endopeptidase (penicillin-binding protein 4)